MTLGVLHKEWLIYWRDRRFFVVLFVMLVVVVGASLDGWSRFSFEARNVAVAETMDREVWDGQGSVNPHAAAHFSRYAFRGLPALAAFDPGVWDFAGSAIWMEAHYQNPASLRRAEDVAAAAPLASLDPAWALRVIAPLILVVLLYGAVAAERENGTLRSLLVHGFRPRHVLFSKTLAAGLVSGGVVLLGLTGAFAPGLIEASGVLEVRRILLLAAAYVVALVSFAWIIVALSASSRSSAAALVLGIAFWLWSTLLVPIGTAQIAGARYPVPGALEFSERIQREAQAPFWSGDAREPTVAAYEAELVRQFDADSPEALGFDRDGVILQAHEIFANEVYDRVYGELYTAHRAQDRALRIGAFLSPVLALERISAGVSGTDLFAHMTFVEAAESHRRAIVLDLNMDMMQRAHGAGFAYLADAELWRTTPDFAWEPPPIGAVARHYLPEAAALGFWLLLGFGLSRRAVMRAFRELAT